MLGTPRGTHVLDARSLAYSSLNGLGAGLITVSLLFDFAVGMLVDNAIVVAEAAGTKIEAFEAKRLRSGVETLLASGGIGKDMRGRLQSHGISGVQAASYDGHDYLPEKKVALEALFARGMGSRDATVLPALDAFAAALRDVPVGASFTITRIPEELEFEPGMLDFLLVFSLVWGVLLATLAMTQFTVAAVTLYLHRDQTHRGIDLHPAVRHLFRVASSLDSAASPVQGFFHLRRTSPVSLST